MTQFIKYYFVQYEQKRNKNIETNILNFSVGVSTSSKFLSKRFILKDWW